MHVRLVGPSVYAEFDELIELEAAAPGIAASSSGRQKFAWGNNSLRAARACDFVISASGAKSLLRRAHLHNSIFPTLTAW